MILIYVNKNHLHETFFALTNVGVNFFGM